MTLQSVVLITYFHVSKNSCGNLDFTLEVFFYAIFTDLTAILKQDTMSSQ